MDIDNFTDEELKQHTEKFQQTINELIDFLNKRERFTAPDLTDMIFKINDYAFSAYRIDEETPDEEEFPFTFNKEEELSF